MTEERSRNIYSLSKEMCVVLLSSTASIRDPSYLCLVGNFFLWDGCWVGLGGSLFPFSLAPPPIFSDVPYIGFLLCSPSLPCCFLCFRSHPQPQHHTWHISRRFPFPPKTVYHWRRQECFSLSIADYYAVSFFAHALLFSKICFPLIYYYTKKHTRTATAEGEEDACLVLRTYTSA